MVDRADSFLQALNATMTASGASALEPDRVQALGRALGLADSEVFNLATSLQQRGLLHIEWGGKVSLSVAGKNQTGETPRLGTIHLGAGATYVGPGAHISGAAVGQGAQSASASGDRDSAVSEEVAAKLVGELAAALTELRHLLPSLPREEQEPAAELESEVAGAIETANSSSGSGTVLAKRLNYVQATLERVSAIGELGKKLTGTAQLLGPALNWARRIILGE
jgi:hypothetical protein